MRHKVFSSHGWSNDDLKGKRSHGFKMEEKFEGY